MTDSSSSSCESSSCQSGSSQSCNSILPNTCTETSTENQGSKLTAALGREEGIDPDLEHLNSKFEKVSATETRKKVERIREDPRAAFRSLLLECDDEVRNARAEIDCEDSSMKIERLSEEMATSSDLTLLCHSKYVDFRAPPRDRSYEKVVSKPIFLDSIRKKIENNMYTSKEQYLEDMRLLYMNTKIFFTADTVSWKALFAQALLQVARDSVSNRKELFCAVDVALEQTNSRRTSSFKNSKRPTKHKKVRQLRSRYSVRLLKMNSAKQKSSEVEEAQTLGRHAPSVGSRIEVYWPGEGKWFAGLVASCDDEGVCLMKYDDGTQELEKLDNERWRTTKKRSMDDTEFVNPCRTKQKRSKPSSSPLSSRDAHPSGPEPFHRTGFNLDSSKMKPTDHATETLTGHLSASFQELKDSFHLLLQDHYERVHKETINSPLVNRVLIKIIDANDKVLSRIEELSHRLEAMEKRVSQFAKYGVTGTPSCRGQHG